MSLWGVSWSHWNGPLDGAKLEDEGFHYAWLKVGGAARTTSKEPDPFFLDHMFDRNIQQLVPTTVQPGGYWYLVPGRAWEQASLFYSAMLRTGVADRMLAQVDIEEPGLTREDIHGFYNHWKILSPSWPLFCYTRKDFWLGSLLGMQPGMILEEAHWVSESVRSDPAKPYASHQYRQVNSEWWNVNYAGWTRAAMLQFTDSALVNGRRVCASRFLGTIQDLINMGAM